jgi:hypothetical protein
MVPWGSKPSGSGFPDVHPGSRSERREAAGAPLVRVTLATEGGRLEIQISGTSDWDLFDHVSDALCDQFDGEWTSKLENEDQRYWDLRVGDATVTLHLDPFGGIVLFPADESAASSDLVHAAREFLSQLEPARRNA